MAALRVPDVLPAAFAVASAISGAHDPVHRTTAVIIVAALSALPLLGRREWPIPVFVIVVTTSLGIGIWSDFRDVNGLALLIALYTVAAHRPLRDALACAAAVAVLIIAVTIGIAGWSWWYYAIFVCGLFAAALGLGLYSATRRAYLAELQDRAERLERERDRPFQPRDRHPAPSVRGHHQDPRQPDPRQARAPRPRAGRHPRLRDRSHRARKRLSRYRVSHEWMTMWVLGLVR
jgi:hypothetical protein